MVLIGAKMNNKEQAANLEREWQSNPRWEGITRPYSAEDVVRLRGSIQIEHTLAKLGAERLWSLLQNEDYVAALGAVTGNQAVQQVRAGLQAIYISGWQAAADANDAGQMYPDQSLYPANSVPNLVRRINQALMRADQVHHSEGKNGIHWFAPMFADAEAGFGGNLNAFELMKAMIEAGAAGVHFEDQLSSAKKCGHLGGKVLVPTIEAVQKLIAARLAADTMGVPTLLMARTDADSAGLLTSDIDPRDQEFILSSERTPEVSTAFAAVWKPRLRAVLLTPLTWICSGARLPNPILPRRENSPKESMPAFQGRCWRITVLRLSIGGRIWTTLPSPAFRANWARWDTNSSSSRWQASTR